MSYKYCIRNTFFSVTFMIKHIIFYLISIIFKAIFQKALIRSHKIVRNNGILLHTRYLWSIGSIALYPKHHIKSRLLSLSSIFKIFMMDASFGALNCSLVPRQECLKSARNLIRIMQKQIFQY